MCPLVYLPMGDCIALPSLRWLVSDHGAAGGGGRLIRVLTGISIAY